MVVLCDTCAVLMLLRIAPGMFRDARFGCRTIHSVWEELRQKREFKTKYPWLGDHLQHIVSIPQGELETAAFLRTLQAVTNIEQTTTSRQRRRAFDLSRRDRRIAAAVLVLGAELCTAEYSLEDFMLQEFERQNRPPLRLVNDWLAGKLIEWNDARQAVLDDWIAQNERPQPEAEIRRFEKLAGRSYPA